MELQELVLRVAVSQLRFRLAPRFADIRGSLIEDLAREFELPEYGWGDAALQVTNAERSRTLTVGAREVRLGFEHVQSVDDFIDVGRRFISSTLERLGVEEVEFVGVRTYWMAAVDDFEELATWLRQRISPDDPLSASIAAEATDLAWVVEFQKKDPKYRITVAPMKVDQLVEQLVATDNRDLFPPTFLFMDFDRFHNDQAMGASDALARWEDSVQKSVDIGSRIAAALRE